MSRTPPTVDELVETLRRSSLPTLLVEGRDDMVVYRWLESTDCEEPVDVLQCGGRSRLLKVYERRNEFARLRCVFLADSDMWLFDKVPNE